MKYASVLVPVPIEKPLTYRIPDSEKSRAVPGVRVEVSLRGRNVVGYLLGEASVIPDEEKIQPVKRVIDEAPVFTVELAELTRWMSETYGSSWYRCFETALPVGYKLSASKTSPRPKMQKVLVPNGAPDEARYALKSLSRKTDLHATILEMVIEQPEVYSAAVLASRLGVSISPVNTLMKNGVLKTTMIRAERDPFADRAVNPSFPLKLNAMQENAVTLIREAMKKERGETVLLRGVTGSGKTEVYLQLIDQVFKGDGGAIVLVPEISLTPQMVDRFRARFLKHDRAVAVIHSALSPGERYDEWRRIASGQARIVVGARSALFAPVKNLKLIIIDEEHETSYKHGETPRYHARETARRRVQLLGGTLLLASATPNVESYHRAKEGIYRLVEMTDRVDGIKLPPVAIVDLRPVKERASKEGKIVLFAAEFRERLRETLAAREQAIIFLNRRGYSRFLLCRQCGYVPKCPECGVSLVYHQRAKNLQCHICERRERLHPVCPECGSRDIRPFGVGTERVVDELKRIYPGVRVLRMDRDTTVRRGSHHKIFKAFSEGRYDVLVGTQVVGKGLDLPGVTFVGIVSADTSLSLPDVFAEERTFNLITQVAGRAGRGLLSGRVVCQTFQPDHPVIQMAARHDYESFYNREIEIRRSSRIPPFARFIRILMEYKEERLLEKESIKEAQMLERLLRDHKIEAEVLGPDPPLIAKVRDLHRRQIILRLVGESIQNKEVVPLLKKTPIDSRIKRTLDVDPVDLL